ncbi:MAG: VTC domain-containing protein, partial [Opitutales bacterium]
MSARFEHKFLVGGPQADALVCELGAALIPDAVAGGAYPVVTLYHDCPAFSALEAQRRGTPFRSKVRVRCYGSDDGRIAPTTFAELKRKDGADGAKGRARGTPEACAALAVGEAAAVAQTDPRDRAAAAEIAAFARQAGLRPACLMRYNRRAWSLGALRLTLDRDLLVRGDDLRPAPDDRRFGTRALEDGLLVLELKGEGAVPLGIAVLLARIGIRPRPFSKYAAGMAALDPLP